MNLTHRSTLAEIAASLRNGKLDLNEHLGQICNRIDEVEPQVRALLPESNRLKRLLREARELLARFPVPQNRPPLFGILVGVKDIFRVDGFETRCGSKLPPELFAGTESTCVTTLRKAGALILGKTVTTEFAYMEPGPTRNPHNIMHTPGGSSSGSAAAVAAGFCELAMGSQTGASVTRPAAFCGIVGFKPSLGRIPTTGVVPFSKTVDHVGLFTQDVDGLELATSILCSEWKTVTRKSKPVLGIPDGDYLTQVSPEALTEFESQCKKLQQAGHVVRRVPALANIKEIIQRHTWMFSCEMAQVHEEWFSKYESLYHPHTAQLFRDGRRVTPQQLDAGRNGILQLRGEMETLMKKEGIDLWICPSALGPAPEGIGSTGSAAMSWPWTHSGMPSLTLPAGRFANGLPVGVQFNAAYMNDEYLLACGQELEKVLA